jgi:hypothetical protein
LLSGFSFSKTLRQGDYKREKLLQQIILGRRRICTLRGCFAVSLEKMPGKHAASKKSPLLT